MHVAYTYHRRAIRHVRISASALERAGIPRREPAPDAMRLAHRRRHRGQLGHRPGHRRRLLDDGWPVVGLSRSQPDRTDLPGLDWRAVDLADAGRRRRGARGGPGRGSTPSSTPPASRSPGRCASSTPTHGDRMHAVHVGAAVRLAACLQGRLADGGRILLIGSRTAEGAGARASTPRPRPRCERSAAPGRWSFAAGAITVNVLEPGPDRDGDDRPTPAARRRHPTPPLGRLVRAEEVAAYASFLLEDDRRHGDRAAPCHLCRSLPRAGGTGGPGYISRTLRILASRPIRL